jgi:hypothetical protein
VIGEDLHNPEAVWRAIPEELRRELEGDAGPGGPAEVPVEIIIASGRW